MLHNHENSQNKLIKEVKELKQEIEPDKEKINVIKLTLSHIGKRDGVIEGIIFIIFSIVLGVIAPIWRVPVGKTENVNENDFKVTAAGKN
ncbi:hypothetical protein [Fictibacillus terranigra]|uniref:Uncharacterized protein n=1 Tax=Fictibacillus terranigra TaxID=3058424 RepID=A0ABT8E1L5_9BACL|nr:hypothetical protein [Fictibacillus sp. CENA-BCM004]MDN4071787.1 hypothetical protein [Fictibacillus sp. CENA-BCM004]